MNIIEQFILAAAADHVVSYVAWEASDFQIDCGEFSGHIPWMPASVIAADLLLSQSDYVLEKTGLRARTLREKAVAAYIESRSSY